MPPKNPTRTRKSATQPTTQATSTATPVPPRVSSKSAAMKQSSRKRPADPDASIVQPQKKLRVGGDTPQLRPATAKGARKGKETAPPPRSRNEDVNSDDELIGIFDEDDEVSRPDESEDEVDQDIVVPQWTADSEAGVRATRQAARTELETPVWQQPPPAQATSPNPGGIDEAPDQVGELDQALPHLLPHPHPHHHQPPYPPHPLQAAEAQWPEAARLIHPARGGKWSLLAQNNTIQAVVQDAIQLVFRHIASVDSFPSGADKVKLVRDSLYQAATTEGFHEITDRLSQDRNFGKWLSSLIDARVSILRGDVRDAASAAIASFHIADPDEATEYLLQDLTYIYPVDPFSRETMNNKPYRHPAIESIIRHVFFHGSSAATYDGIYHSSIPELDELEVPIPMAALAATAVHAAIDDWGRDRGPFSASLYEDVYRRHIATLESIKAANIRAFHAITGSIYRNCLRNSGVLRTVQPLTLNMGGLSTSLD